MSFPSNPSFDFAKNGMKPSKKNKKQPKDVKKNKDNKEKKDKGKPGKHPGKVTGKDPNERKDPNGQKGRYATEYPRNQAPKQQNIPREAQEGKILKEMRNQQPRDIFEQRSYDIGQNSKPEPERAETPRVKEAIIEHDVLKTKKLITSLYDEKITIGRDLEHKELASVINMFSGQHMQAKFLQVQPGEYSGRIRIDRISSSVSIEGYSKGLRIVGDRRNIVGHTFINEQKRDESLSYAGKVAIITKNNTVSISIDDSLIDFLHEGIRPGDKVILMLQGENNSFSSLEVIVHQLEDELLYITNDLTSFEIRSVTFSPNVSFFVDDDKMDPILTVVDASVTFKGVRFTSKTNNSEIKRLSVVSLIGCSTVNMMNCLIYDTGYGSEQQATCHNALLVKYGATLMASEMINVSSEDCNWETAYFPITVIGGDVGVRVSATGKIVDAHIYSSDNKTSFVAEPGSGIYAKSLTSMHSDDEFDISKGAKILVY